MCFIASLSNVFANSEFKTIGKIIIRIILSVISSLYGITWTLNSILTEYIANLCGLFYW